MFAIQGFPGGDTTAAASSLASSTDTLTAGIGPLSAPATTVGPAFTVPSASCATPPNQHGST